ncbi:HPP family protein [Aestuariivirga sp.]|uniref:HPP family protein n=1 Tax=Aestuariivirga sp. TaxID=2650926 RepID=UPI0039E6356F
MAGFKFFSPILSGATFGERLLACLGALIGIGLTGLICGLSFGNHAQLPLIVAPMGASAVLLFAVPASPLAQPWPVIGGNTISALVGVSVLHLVKDPLYAAGLAVGLAILIMSLTRSLHPPGGAAALTAVVGGAVVKDAGFWFPFVPVAINSIVLVIFGMLFHRAMRRPYPHRPQAQPVNVHKTADAAPVMRAGFQAADIDAALAGMHETFDIDRADLDALLRGVEQKALERAHGSVTCGDIMSRDIISAPSSTSPDAARTLLLAHDIRTLPVTGGNGELLGTVGLRELAGLPDSATLPMSRARTARADDPAISLLPALTDGLSHAVVITDAAGAVEGIVSQTDLLAALGKSLLRK